ncbi:MAG: response regulator [Phycisphaerae bacterium]|nr:response regulator [Phycisphaerae bacterium]
MKRVLYLDDSLMALRMMERMLKDVVQVFSAATILDAEEILADGPIDMVITDYLLDDGNGIDFARRLREDPLYKEIPILLVSAGLSSEVAFESMRAGINQCFRKPLRPAEIRDIVPRQIESPWIEEVTRSKLYLHGISWKKNGTYHEYSPDLDHRVSADTKQEVHQEMTRQLKNLVGGRMEFEEVTGLQIVEYNLDVE